MQAKTSLSSQIILCRRLGEAFKNRWHKVHIASFLILIEWLLASFTIFLNIAFSTNYSIRSWVSAVMLLDAQQASYTIVGISVFMSACSLSRIPENTKFEIVSRLLEANMLAKILVKDTWMARLLK